MKITTEHEKITLSHKRFAVLFFLPSCCVSAETGVKNGGSFLLVTEKIEKAPNSIHITIQYPTNNGFRNTNKHPEGLSRTKYKSPFKKVIQTRYFSRFQSIEFHLAHEKYVVWTASLRRRFSNRKYRLSYTVRFRDSLFPTFKLFIYMKKWTRY